MHPPSNEETLTGHMTAEVVQQWGKEFDIDALVVEERKDLGGECGT